MKLVKIICLAGFSYSVVQAVALQNKDSVAALMGAISLVVGGSITMKERFRYWGDLRKWSATQRQMAAAEEALARACNLAHDYYARNMSPNALMAESGYREHRDVIDVEKIRKHVAAHQKLVGDWLEYSENKRVSSRWFFYTDSVNGPYVVGYFPTNDPSRTEKQYSDKNEACAVYIKYELESIATSGHN